MVIVFISFLEMLGCSRSKEINIFPFLTQYTTHKLIVADALGVRGEKKVEAVPITVPPSGQSTLVRLHAPVLRTERFRADLLWLILQNLRLNRPGALAHTCQYG